MEQHTDPQDSHGLQLGADPWREMAAAQGAGGGGNALAQQMLQRHPHASLIERSLGLSVPGTAEVDASACEREGVDAFTVGTHSIFSTPEPSLDVAVHEAAHKLQHSGALKDAGLDPELQAEALAETVASSGRVDPLMGGGPAGAGSRVPSGTRAYIEITDADQKAKKEWEVGSTARVGDAGMTVTTGMKHECYADPGLVASANELLQAKSSGVSIKSGSKKISGEAPDGSGKRTLTEVVPTIAVNDATSGDQTFWADCGRSSREVMGPTGTDSAPRGVYDDGLGTTKTTTASSTNPANLRDDIFVKAGLGTTPDAARAAYMALSATDREAFDKKHGINKYATPDVGDAFVSRRHDQALQPGDAAGFNFHWGGVIMAAGPDRVTFENFAKPGTTYDSKDTAWYFETYGPPTKAGQTWHEQNQGSVGGDVSDDNITMAATTADYPTMAAALSTRSLIDRATRSDREEELSAVEAELKSRNIKVSVNVKETEDWTGADEVYVEVSSGVGLATTSVVDLNDGHGHTFTVSLAGLLPLTGPLTGPVTVKVYDKDVFFDDLLVDMTWSAPYDKTTNSSTKDGADLAVEVDFDR